MNKMQNIKDNLSNIKNHVQHNLGIYAAAGLMALSACERPIHREIKVDCDKFIGKNHIHAEMSTVTRSGNSHTNYTIEKVLDDQTEIRYYDYSNDRSLDNLTITPPDGKTTYYNNGAFFNAARKDYKHLRDTIAILNGTEAAKSDAENINKYFGRE